MYSLVSGLYQYLTQREHYYVLVLGLDNAGKTTLIEQIKTTYIGTPALGPEQIKPTVGLNVKNVPVGGETLSFWDLGGQTDLQALWESYFHECHAIVFVVDSTDNDRMQECQQSFERVASNGLIVSVPILVLANKQDQASAVPVHEIKEIFNRIALQLSVSDSNVLSVSALHGKGVREAVEWLHLRVQRNRAARPGVFK